MEYGKEGKRRQQPTRDRCVEKSKDGESKENLFWFGSVTHLGCAVTAGIASGHLSIFNLSLKYICIIILSTIVRGRKLPEVFLYLYIVVVCKATFVHHKFHSIFDGNVIPQNLQSFHFTVETTGGTGAPVSLVGGVPVQVVTFGPTIIPREHSSIVTVISAREDGTTRYQVGVPEYGTIVESVRVSLPIHSRYAKTHLSPKRRRLASLLRHFIRPSKQASRPS
eukprot:scaffold5520_cov167-Amphora_coffeaeformis.AAC.5